MARIKGTNFVHTRSFVEATFGLEGWAAVLAEMPVESRAVLESVVAVGWYAAHLHVDELHAIERALRASDARVLHRAGAYAAEFDVTRILRLLFRFANPGVVLEKGAEIWSRFYDTGAWTIERPSPSSAVGILREFEIVDARYCAFLTGYFTHLFELVGAKDVRVLHPQCRSVGDDVCRFDASWT